MYIDTHTHLYDGDSVELQNEHIDRAIAAGVGRMYMPNCDLATVAPMMRIARDFPQHCFPMIGLHPCYVKENFVQELSQLEQILGQGNGAFCAVGEIGLDYYWDKTFVAQQQEAFECQIDWALRHRLPIVIHSRESTAECIETVAAKQNGDLNFVFHCFSGDLQQALRITEMGGYLGIGGVVTYKKSVLPDILGHIPLEHIVLETDAPYLAPVPYRGKANESTYIPLIAEKLADIYRISPEELAEITTINALKIFSHR